MIPLNQWRIMTDHHIKPLLQEERIRRAPGLKKRSHREETYLESNCEGLRS